jgi:signal peptidase
MSLLKESKFILMLLILFLVITFGFTFISRTISGTNFPFAVVQSGSMEPNVPIGSLLFIQRVSGNDLMVGGPPIGDVVVYYFPNEKVTDYFLFTVYDPTPWSHRAIDKAEINGEYYVLTKGDANKYSDQTPSNPSSWVPMDRVIGKVAWHIPYLGYPLLWMKNPFVFLAVLIFLIILIIMPEGRKKNDKADGASI